MAIDDNTIRALQVSISHEMGVLTLTLQHVDEKVTIIHMEAKNAALLAEGIVKGLRALHDGSGTAKEEDKPS